MVWKPIVHLEIHYEFLAAKGLDPLTVPAFLEKLGYEERWRSEERIGGRLLVARTQWYPRSNFGIRAEQPSNGRI